MQPFVSVLGTELGLTSKEIADIIWLALQIQESGETETTPSEPATSPQADKHRSRSSPDTASGIISDKQPDRTSSTPSAEVHHQSNVNQTGFGKELTLRVPDARSLREPLSLARSLKPLLQRAVTGWSTVLDEAATVERIADEQFWLPVFKPALEPWLDLALVVDESVSMQIWQRTIAELQRLLSHYGVFRDVRVWGLVTNDQGQVKLRSCIGATSRQQATRQPSELIDPSGRRLILLATDCVGSHWQDSTVLSALKLWAKSGPLAIVQMLPEWLWSRTSLGFASAVKLQSLFPAVPNQQLDVKNLSSWDEVDLETGIKIPVVTLEPEPFTAWTEMVMGKGGAWSPGFVFEPEAVTPNGQVTQLSNVVDEGAAEQRVQRFRVTASPMARRLAGLLAAAPVISLPVVRIIQDQLLSESRQVHVAEVFLGGLLKPLGEIEPEMHPDLVQYDFLDGVREVLLASVPTSDSIDVLEEVSKFVAERLGLSLDAFAAVLRNPQQAKSQELENQSRPFAMVTAQILRELGGEYVQFAEELEYSNQIGLQSDTVYGSPEKSIKYQVGGSLPSSSPSYIVRQADKKLYETLKAGGFCYVFSPRQMGKSSLRVQTMQRLQADGVACAVIDLTEVGSWNTTPDQWYGGIALILLDCFELTDRCNLRQWWKERDQISSVQRFSEFIETILLTEITQNLVIFVDEVDCALNLNFFTDDFFAVIRNCYAQRVDKTAYHRLTFALLGVVNPSALSRNHGSPLLNVCQSVRLEGFKFQEALPLAQGLKKKAENPQAVLREILFWTGGQPFLTQRLCHLVLGFSDYIVANNEKQAIEQLVKQRIIEDWYAQDASIHLTTIRDRLLGNEQTAIRLLSTYQQILQQGEIRLDNSLEQIELRLIGLVVEHSRKLRVCNPIYQAIFNQEWVDKQLSSLRPYSESLNLWLASGCKNEAYLLRGPALKISLALVSEKQLGDQDYQFLTASQELNDRVTASQPHSTQTPESQTLVDSSTPNYELLVKERIALDDQLSNRYIELDPTGYFLIYLDREAGLICAKHYSNIIDDKRLAYDPETGEASSSSKQISRTPTTVFTGRTAKEMCIKIFEETKPCPVSYLDHAVYLGREFMRAEIALLNAQEYIQD